mmetsp:Transcript_69547/g.141399  ORF Transcript_69547/g.141399 Transcript_69547/m.141399 type:complete len:648 (-) Transcript_69547:152-2095(-)
MMRSAGGQASQQDTRPLLGRSVWCRALAQVQAESQGSPRSTAKVLPQTARQGHAASAGSSPGLATVTARSAGSFQLRGQPGHQSAISLASTEDVDHSAEDRTDHAVAKFVEEEERDQLGGGRGATYSGFPSAHRGQEAVGHPQQQQANASWTPAPCVSHCRAGPGSFHMPVGGRKAASPLMQHRFPGGASFSPAALRSGRGTSPDHLNRSNKGLSHAHSASSVPVVASLPWHQASGQVEAIPRVAVAAGGARSGPRAARSPSYDRAATGRTLSPRRENTAPVWQQGQGQGNVTRSFSYTAMPSQWAAPAHMPSAPCLNACSMADVHQTGRGSLHHEGSRPTAALVATVETPIAARLVAPPVPAAITTGVVKRQGSAASNFRLRSTSPPGPWPQQHFQQQLQQPPQMQLHQQQPQVQPQQQQPQMQQRLQMQQPQMQQQQHLQPQPQPQAPVHRGAGEAMHEASRSSDYARARGMPSLKTESTSSLKPLLATWGLPPAEPIEEVTSPEATSMDRFRSAENLSRGGIGGKTGTAPDTSNTMASTCSTGSLSPKDGLQWKDPDLDDTPSSWVGSPISGRMSAVGLPLPATPSQQTPTVAESLSPSPRLPTSSRVSPEGVQEVIFNMSPLPRSLNYQKSPPTGPVPGSWCR